MAEMDSLEYQILAAYAQQREVRSRPGILMPMFRSEGLEEKVEKQGRRLEKPAWKQGVPQYQGGWSPPLRFPKLLPSGESLKLEARNLGDDEEEDFQGFSFQGPTVKQMGAASPQVEPAVAIANRLAEIVHAQPQQDSFKKVVFRCAGDSQNTIRKESEDQIIMKIVELLKYAGDQLQQELKKDNTLKDVVQKLNYSTFKSIVDRFLGGVNTRGKPEVGTLRTRVAFAVDVTARLTSVDNHPMNRVLGFGSKYLRENFTPWVQQHGGWEKVLGVAHEDEVE
ncbi:apoptosis facilitator Bcl-2-like protein 14 [Tachyglossus aculeatus]|uniref:apoptosis facilitator Bcl-2-like protein 14 n=1 Tax=Tachyglossus aculeatus TaxID=9261 RepID=UPI0018F782AE|nr:apoptosis facilitator Bcl-2-like protein 14 [Tachyglossus aculeatus]XP_038610418.1 apoptosis facilitator Bcl-2-like protein 14 [Tachyglossus aculeatus]